MKPQWQTPRALYVFISLQQKLLALKKQEIDERLERLKAKLQTR